MSSPRSIADVIRSLDAAALAELIRLRPDLATPRPLELSELVERSSSTTSTQLAVESLDAWQRRVCLGLAACEDAVSTRRLAALMQAERADVEVGIQALVRRALVWGTERGWHLTHAARAAFGPFPAGLASASAMPLTDAEIDTRLAEVGPAAKLVLDKLLWTTPTGRVQRAESRGLADSDNPIDQLLYRRLLRVLDNETIILPREVAIRLRGGRLFEDRVAARVPAWDAAKPSSLVEHAGLGSAFAAVRALEALVEAVERIGVRPLTTGAIGRRDLAALSREVDSEDEAKFWLGLAHSAGLLAASGASWLPTTAWDEWLQRPDWERWQQLVEVWQQMELWTTGSSTLLPGNAHDPWAPAVRSAAMDELRSAAAGTPVDEQRLIERLRWRHPQWRIDLETLCPVLVEEFRMLGLTALGRRTALVDVDEDPGFPEPADHFLLQSDMTAVVPAPLRHDLARTMALLADRESNGGGGVHRFTAESLRRGLDAGWSPERIGEWLEQHSSTPVPQALDYLLGDVARRHGRVQVAAVASVVTVDDAATAQMLAARPEAAELGLRLLAPNVLVATADPAEVVGLLREHGLAPVALDGQGGVHTTPEARRSRPAGRLRPRSEPSRIEQIVAQMLARDDDRRNASEQASIVKTLSDNIARPGWLRVDYVSSDGSPQRDEVRAMALSAGQARLMRKGVGPFDLPLARIISVVEIPRG